MPCKYDFGALDCLLKPVDKENVHAVERHAKTGRKKAGKNSTLSTTSTGAKATRLVYPLHQDQDCFAC